MPDPQLIQGLLSAGPWGICTLLCIVIVFLYRALAARDERIAALNERRVEVAVRNEAVITSVQAALGDLTKSLASAVEDSDDRFETVRSMQQQLLALAQVVAGLGETLKEIRKDLLEKLLSDRRGQS